MGIIESQLETALSIGFDAVKVEVLFGDLVTDDALITCIRDSRRMVGDDIIMALDFGYRWQSWADANGSSTAWPTATSTSPRRPCSTMI